MLTLFNRQLYAGEIMSNKRYFTAKEAAAELEITVATLYAYVSRGLIRSESGDGKTRAKVYRAEDVNALKSRKELRRNPAKAAETALHFGQPVMESAITLIQNGRLHYRGHDVIGLPDQHSFEAVAMLIWSGSWAGESLFASPLPTDLWQHLQSIEPQLTGLAPIEAFQVMLPFLAAHDLAAYDLSETAVMQTGARILKLLTATSALLSTGVISNTPSTIPIAQALQQAWLPNDPQAAHLINAALIFCADHELNVSAFSARTVASAQATPYAAIIAGMAALRGRLHGGATEQVEALFREVGAPQQARDVIENRLKRGDHIPGFGHPLYPEGDPRGRELLKMATAVYPNSAAVEMARGVETAVSDTIGLLPTLDMGLATIAHAAQLPRGTALTLFALGRTAGWIGHTIEQYQQNQLIRPRARYSGEPPI